MKFTIDRAPLLKTLAHVQSVVERRNTVPVLANFKFDAGADALAITGTDMEIAVVETLPLSIDRPGSTTVPASTLYDMMKRLPESAKVAFDQEPGTQTLSIKAGRFSTTLTTLPADEFPEMMRGDLPFEFAIPADELHRLFDKTEFAMSTEETRYYLNGVHLHVPDGGKFLRAVATDGHRLARLESRMETAGVTDALPPIIVPRKAVGEILKLLDGQDSVQVRLSETKLQVEVGAVLLTTRLVEGTFPDYERVIPRGNDRVCRVGRDAFVAAVGRVAAVSGEKARPVKLALASNSLTISTTGDKGEAREEMGEEDVTYAGPEFEIGFQARYLTDIASQVGGLIEFQFGDGNSPALVVDPDDAGAVFVLMPMRV